MVVGGLLFSFLLFFHQLGRRELEIGPTKEKKRKQKTKKCLGTRKSRTGKIRSRDRRPLTFPFQSPTAGGRALLPSFDGLVTWASGPPSLAREKVPPTNGW